MPRGGLLGTDLPEYSFVSSDPDIADFVKQDPASTNLRKPFLDANDKVVTDNSSGLLCPFNAGTTTVTVSAGGFSYSEQVTVLGGSVQRPCGTRPLRPDRFKRAECRRSPARPAAARSSRPAAARRSTSPRQRRHAGAARPSAAPNPPPPNPPPPPASFLAPATPPLAVVPAIVPPPPPPIVRPLPPGGAPARTYQVEEKREEEAAIEESQAFSRYEPESGMSVPPYLLGLVLLAALAGASVRGGPGAAPKSQPARPRFHPRRTQPKESQMTSQRTVGIVAWSALALALGAFVLSGAAESIASGICRGPA